MVMACADTVVWLAPVCLWHMAGIGPLFVVSSETAKLHELLAIAINIWLIRFCSIPSAICHQKLVNNEVQISTGNILEKN